MLWRQYGAGDVLVLCSISVGVRYAGQPLMACSMEKSSYNQYFHVVHTFIIIIIIIV